MEQWGRDELALERRAFRFAEFQRLRRCCGRYNCSPRERRDTRERSSGANASFRWIVGARLFVIIIVMAAIGLSEMEVCDLEFTKCRSVFWQK